MSKVELLNPFFTSIYDALEEISGEKVQRGQLYLRKDDLIRSEGCSLLIEISGQLKGQVVLDMSTQMAIKFAEIMNMEEIGEFNEQVKASMIEMANIVCEQSTQRLTASSIEFEIQAPRLSESENLNCFNHAENNVIAAPLELPFGQIVIYLALLHESEQPVR